MKIVLSLSVLILLLSCGKYDKPFITFKSPEKRLMGTTWRCVKAVDSSGVEFEVSDYISFAIDGIDSTCLRITNHCANSYNPEHCSGIEVANDTINLTSTWGYALGDNYNKQLIKVSSPGYYLKTLYVTSLSNKKLVFQDQSFDNTTYHYAPL